MLVTPASSQECTTREWRNWLVTQTNLDTEYQFYYKGGSRGGECAPPAPSQIRPWISSLAIVCCIKGALVVIVNLRLVLIGTTIEHTIATTGLLIMVTYRSRQRWKWTHFYCLSRQGVSSIYAFFTDWQDAIRTVKLVVCATKEGKEIITVVSNGFQFYSQQ